MRVIIDTNRIIAALVKNSTTRKILFDEYFDFLTPEHTLSEIEEHKEELKEIAQLTFKNFDVLLALLFEYIEIIPYSNYERYLHECKLLISDPDDAPLLAAALSSQAEGIWAHDPHFKEQNKIKVFTNIDMLRISGKARN